MPTRIMLQIVLLLLLCASLCQASFYTVTSSTPSTTSISDSVRYRCVMNNQWTAARHPHHYPDNPALRGTVLVTHSSRYALFSRARPLARGMASLAETGLTMEFLQEIFANSAVVSDVKVGPDVRNVRDGSRLVLNDVALDASHPFVSAATRLSPSPDWMAGFRSLRMHDGNHWFASVRVEAMPWDGGVVTGDTYTSVGVPQDPPVAPVVFADTDSAIFDKDGSILPVLQWSCTLQGAPPVLEETPTWAPIDTLAPIATPPPMEVPVTLPGMTPMTTVSPVTATPTGAPVLPTAAPVFATGSPVTTTATPVTTSPTGTPVVTPISPTGSPVMPSVAPVTTTPTRTPVVPPTAVPISPTEAPVAPVVPPTVAPSLVPTMDASSVPTVTITANPTAAASSVPSAMEKESAINVTDTPTVAPSLGVSASPSVIVTVVPNATNVPKPMETTSPTSGPTIAPTEARAAPSPATTAMPTEVVVNTTKEPGNSVTGVETESSGTMPWLHGLLLCLLLANY